MPLRLPPRDCCVHPQIRWIVIHLGGRTMRMRTTYFLKKNQSSERKDMRRSWHLLTHPRQIDMLIMLDYIPDLSDIQGLLLTGPPGSGKSFLVDLWFSSLPTPFKARKHYNQLVLEVYRGVWEETQRRMTNGNSSEPLLEPKTPWNRAIRSRWQELLRSGASPAIWNRSSAFSSGLTASGPTIAFVIARRLILNHWLLVFDEIQLLDVSSANLLADILSWYWRMGGVIVGTSNKVPEDLYQNGVQRERLGPFVEALKARCPVVTMESHQDWRVVRGGDGTNRSWFKQGQESKFHKYLASITSSEFGTPYLYSSRNSSINLDF